jgi:hypothetical protein
MMDLIRDLPNDVTHLCRFGCRSGGFGAIFNGEMGEEHMLENTARALRYRVRIWHSQSGRRLWCSDKLLRMVVR